MDVMKSKLLDSILKKISFLGILLLSISCFGQKDDTSSTLQLKFICDHSQTTIIADQSIIIYIMSLDHKLLVKEISYCSRKELKLPKGTYSVIIESSKYCTHIIDNYVVAEKEQKIELNLLKESDPECKNEQNFEPHPTRFN